MSKETIFGLIVWIHLSAITIFLGVAIDKLDLIVYLLENSK